ncbi:MAG: hypothetical protein H0V73_10100 [Chloroflexi bacterium]|nr:hypothetical protein [Chloroflexota bacterium]
MDTAAVIAFPRPKAANAADASGPSAFGATPAEPARLPAPTAEASAAALAEIDAAIDLVESRVARRVRLTAVPFVESAAAEGLAHARSAGMAFDFERTDRIGVVTVTVGPLLSS